MKILVVEDETYARTAIEESIKAADNNLQVFAAETGESALAMLEKEPFDVVLTDIKMPGMDGLELLAEIRKLDLAVQVIILSSYNDFDLTRQAIQLGAFDYLFKPAMLPNDIMEVIQKALCRQKEGLQKKDQNPDGKDGFCQMNQEMKITLEYIHDKLCDKNLSLQMVADHAGLSRNYFSKVFKDAMGVNFIDYVTRLRVEKAKELYTTTSMKIYEIAETVGYSDWHYLYSVYKKHVGHSMSRDMNGKETGRKL